MTGLLCIGHLNVEDTAYEGRAAVPAMAGGAALYSSIAAKIWGIEVAIVSRIGENYPEEYLSELKNGGIFTEWIRRIPGPTMAGQTSYDRAGNRSYTMYAEAERRLQLTPFPADIPTDSIIGYQGVHIATMPPQVQKQWIDSLRVSIEFISIDTDISFIQSNRKQFESLLSRVDAIFPNRAEAEAFLPGLPLDLIAEKIMAYGLRIVVIKCGSDGARIYQKGGNNPIVIPAIHGSVVDVTGAGDSFAGGFLAGYLLSGDIQRAGFMGAISASLAIEDYGGIHTIKKYKEIDCHSRLLNLSGENRT